jgi:ABC-type Mn2+/Zn2+ transport system permease subunit
LDFVRKVSWRLITLILAGAAILALSPASFLNFDISEQSQTALAWAVFIGVLIGFLFRKLRWFHHIDTWIHEFGHAAMVSAFGGLPKYIKLNQDSSGVTTISIILSAGLGCLCECPIISSKIDPNPPFPNGFLRFMS